MRKIAILIIFAIFVIALNLFSNPVIVKRDNGVTVANGYASPATWEETAILQPAGPCNVTEIQVYYVGNQAATDTLYIVGDPSEGSIAPTLWVEPYNILIPPIVVNYDGNPGWKYYPVTGLRSDGYDRIIVQHRLGANGPWFAYDNNGFDKPYGSYLMDPTHTNSLGGPGVYYLANGDFLVRLKVVYDYPVGDSSASPPAPVLLDVNKLVGLTNSDGSYIGASDVSVVDWNNDGFDDIAIGSNYFQNNGDGTFKNVSSQINVPAGFTAWGDYNNDGNIDIYSVTNGPYIDTMNMMMSTNKIYKNNGNGTFTPQDNKKIFMTPYPNPSVDFGLAKQYQNDSIPNPYPCISSVWSDFNNDGFLDLYFANNRVGYNNAQGTYEERYFPDQLYLSNGDGTMSLKTKTNGISAYEPFNNSNPDWFGYYDCYGANACDYNVDGKPDIFVATYRLAPDVLYSNQGNGMFINKAAETGVQGITPPSGLAGYFGHGMGCEWADFNNDGYPDLVVGNLGHPDWRGSVSNPSLIFRNDGPPNFHFTEMHQQMGLKFKEMNSGVLWADLDLDGYQDLWHGQISYSAEGANDEPKRFPRYYLNQGPPDFKLKDATWLLGQGVRVHNCWSAARIDFDHDGDLDIVVTSGGEGTKLFRNDMKHLGTWIAFRLKGSPQNNVNMDCYGSKVIVYANGKLFFRELSGSASGTRGTQNSNELHFGLGKSSTIDSVVVYYPNNKSKVYNKNLMVNTRYIIPYLSDPIQNGIATPALDYPANFQTGLTDTLTLRWNICGGAKSYHLQVSTKQDFSVMYMDNSNVTDVNKKLISLPPNTTYFWRVKASDGNNNSLWSSVWMFTVGMPAPLSPALIAPINDSVNVSVKPTFVWSNVNYSSPYGNTTSYELIVSENNNFSQPTFDSTAILDTTCTNSVTLKSSTKYYWKVRGINQSISNGDWSQVWDFTTQGAPEKVILLTPVNNDSNVDTRPTLKWNAGTGATNYHLQVADNPTFNNPAYEYPTLSITSIRLLKGLPTGTDFYWHVSAINNGGEGPWSDTWHFRTQGTKSVEELSLISDGLKISCSPNPARELINIQFSLPDNGLVRLEAVNTRGEIIDNIYESLLSTGSYKADWYTGNFENGVYLIRLITGNKTISEKIVIYR